MELITQAFVLFTVSTIACNGLPGTSETTPDPSVFLKSPPPEFMKFFLLKNGESEMGKIPLWPIPNNDMKYPEWFHISDNKPQTDVEVTKNKENDVSEFMSYQRPLEDKLDAKDVFPPHYNVFLANAYPHWMTLPGFHDGYSTVDKKQSVTSELTPKDSDKLDLLDNLKPSNKDIAEIDDDIRVEKSPASNSKQLKLAENIKEDKKIASEHILLGNSDAEKDKSKDIISADSVPVFDDFAKTNLNSAPVNPIQNLSNGIIPPQDKASELGNVVILTPLNKAMLTAPNTEKNSELVKVIGNSDDETENPDDKEGQNLTPNDYLYVFLQKIKPLFSSAGNADTGPTSPVSVPIQPMVIVTDEPPKLQGRDNLSGNNVLVDNVDKHPSDQIFIAKPLTNPVIAQNNGDSPNLSQGMNPQSIPNQIPGNLRVPNIPNNPAFNQPILQNNNQGNIPPNNYAMPGNNLNQYNYPQNVGQPVLLGIPNNGQAPMNYPFTNLGPQYQGNLNNGQLQANPGLVNPNYSNNIGVVYPGVNTGNNMGYLSPGMNPGQNLYAIVALPNSVNVNAVPSPYMNGNAQVNPNMYQVPLYNLVPVRVNTLANTKDEADV